MTSFISFFSARGPGLSGPGPEGPEEANPLDFTTASQAIESSRRPPGAELVILALLCAAGLLQIVIQGIVPAWQHAGGDFANYYTGARLVAQGADLSSAYRDFTWFQQQIDGAGIERQLGGFIPHPPPTALVMMPLSTLNPLSAKRVWTLTNLGLAALAAWLISRVFALNLLWSSAILFAAWSGLVNNIRFGQLYLLILVFLLLGLRLWQHGRPVAAGFFLGALCPVKYVGAAWLAESAWRGRWKMVASGLSAAAGVTALAIWMTGWEPFAVFLSEVLPRHLAGELQDPFSLRLQSWNSLLRRLFLAEPIFNPQPWKESPGWFFFTRALSQCLIGGFSVLMVCSAQLENLRLTTNFRWGWLALAVLLLSPGGATYHFLLLTISAGAFIQIFLSRGQRLQAVATLLLCWAVNVPHHLWVEDWATFWTPLAYTRLWMLLLFAAAVVAWTRPAIQRQAADRAVILAWTGWVLLSGAWQWSVHQPLDIDRARPLVISGPEFGRHLGLILDHPDIGTNQTVFTYCEIFAERYAVWAEDGRRWTPPLDRNFTNPSLGPDGRLLVETVREGRTEIWVSEGRGAEPSPLTVGEDPAWSPPGDRFVFSRKGRLHLQSGEPAGSQILPSSGPASRPAFSSDGRLAYVVETEDGFSVRTLELETGAETEILHQFAPIHSLSWSENGALILFSTTTAGNRDIWSVAVGDRSVSRLTSHRGRDDNPVWDARNGRIVFTSDRGRGLEFSTLYWIPLPENSR